MIIKRENILINLSPKNIIIYIYKQNFTSIPFVRYIFYNDMTRYSGVTTLLPNLTIIIDVYQFNTFILNI